MSSEVKRYDAVHLRYEDCNIRYGEGCEVEVVTASDYAAIEAECERLRQFEIAYNDWQAKTDWVQESAKSHELGRHRADVLRARIDALAAELAAIKRREPVCEVSEETFSSDGTSDIITCNLPIGTKLYAALSAQQSAQHPDDAAVDRFAAAMKSKLAKSREKGRHGWQAASAAHLSSLLYRHMYKADPLDVANLAMMLHQNGQAIELPFEARTPAEQQSAPERVSVPRELLESAACLLELGDMDGPTYRELRALLNGGEA